MPELTPTFCMPVIAQGKDAVYLRLPADLQRDCGGCACPTCKADPSKAKWDTLCVPLLPRRGPRGSLGYSWTVHCPDGPALDALRAALHKTLANVEVTK